MQDLLGIMGGMGPYASALFYRMITEQTKAARDQDHLRLLLLSDAGMPDRTAAILSEDKQKEAAVRERMLSNAELLQRAGCRAIAVTCNTAHYFVDQIASELSIPVIHMIRETARRAAAICGGGRAAILATDGTIRTGLYQQALAQVGVEAYVPTEASQRLVMHVIYNCVKKGKPADLTAWGTVEQELLEAGCRRAILACTELSCVKADEGLGDFYLDPLEVLARCCIRFMGKDVRIAV